MQVCVCVCVCVRVCVCVCVCVVLYMYAFVMSKTININNIIRKFNFLAITATDESEITASSFLCHYLSISKLKERVNFVF